MNPLLMLTMVLLSSIIAHNSRTAQPSLARSIQDLDPEDRRELLRSKIDDELMLLEMKEETHLFGSDEETE